MKVYLRTYGCQMNERDSEHIAADFAGRGWEIADSPDDADAIIVNACSVREQAELKVVGLLGRLVSARLARPRGGLPAIGLIGCMAQNFGAKIVSKFPEIDFVAGSHKTAAVPDIAEEIVRRRLAGIGHPPLPEGMGRRTARFSEAFVDISDDPSDFLKVDKHLSAPPSALVSVMQGCQMNCSYCIVPKVRGAQRSRPMADILREIEYLAERGTREVTLLGQVVNAYGREFPREGGISNFVRLLRAVNEIGGIERIRFTSPHPSYFSDELIDSYGSLEKLCEYVHLPLQSGSDAVLKKMNRPYRAGRFLDIVSRLRKRVPNISISTDIIVGFPGETEEDFELTRSAFREAGFDMAFIFRYSPRAGTPSAEMPDDVPEEEKRRRNAELLGELEKTSRAYNGSLVGSVQEVLVEGPARRGEGVMMGRTRTHRKALFKAPESLAGSLARVKVLSATTTALEAELA